MCFGRKICTFFENGSSALPGDAILKSYIKGRNALQYLDFTELKWEWVDNADSVIDAVSNITKYGRIAVGANYDRKGAISLIEIATPQDELFIFDIRTLSASAFEDEYYESNL